MDTFVRGRIAADNILQNTDYKKLRKQRYESFEFEKGEISLEGVSKIAREGEELKQISGKQELFEQIIANSFLKLKNYIQRLFQVNLSLIFSKKFLPSDFFLLQMVIQLQAI